MLNKKTAFTLAEVLIVFSIIGTLTIISMTVAGQRKDVSGLSYYRAYEALKTAGYNIFSDVGVAGKPFPTKVDSKSGGLCQELVRYINAAEVTCNSKYMPLSGNDADFTEERRQFVATNAMSFYIAKPKENITKLYPQPKVKPNIVWFVIFVDLNGERGPNTMLQPKHKNGSPADIVAFAMTNEGEVVPLGYPTISKKYLIAQITYPNQPRGDKLVEKRRSADMTYFEAIHKAWGAAEDPANAETINFVSRIPGKSNIRLANKMVIPPIAGKKVIVEDGLPGGCIPFDFACKVVIKQPKP